ncbi:hypothetical protein ACIOEX_26150 [Streptomyces sp. NPDC087850]|uniref:hypothetical protein n=1 Tax=Streptomyces sp. NPDC087850 TaxID=3365809 RepID=UPI003818352B
MTITTTAALCPKTGASRWTSPTDPGPYTVGETIECPHCGTGVTGPGTWFHVDDSTACPDTPRR